MNSILVIVPSMYCGSRVIDYILLVMIRGPGEMQGVAAAEGGGTAAGAGAGGKAGPVPAEPCGASSPAEHAGAHQDAPHRRPQLDQGPQDGHLRVLGQCSGPGALLVSGCLRPACLQMQA